MFSRTEGIGVGGVLGVCVTPFLIPDAVELALAEIVGERVRKAVRA
ncbi:MAG: hypothetical protein IKE24_03755 [Clostridia bacterium]|nr:hypothetical protein [Clostridia bacterium]